MIGDGPGSGGGGGGTTGTGNGPDGRDAPVQMDEGAGQQEPTLDELQEELELAAARIADLERRLARESERHALERLLEDAGAIDLETAVVLAERMLAEGGVTPAEAVSRLAKSKAYLFRSARGGPIAGPIAGPVAGRGAGALSGEPSVAPDSLERLAAEARETGDRRAVLRYLRRRRG